MERVNLNQTSSPSSFSAAIIRSLELWFKFLLLIRAKTPIPKESIAENFIVLDKKSKNRKAIKLPKTKANPVIVFMLSKVIGVQEMILVFFLMTFYGDL